MILYLDTSALVKLFVAEPQSEAVRRAARKSAIITTHLLAYVEACSAFVRLGEMRKDRSLAQRLRAELDAYWTRWEVIEVEEPLIRRAADFCARYRLRGYDGVHLAAAERVHGLTAARAEFRFGVFDRELARAASELGLDVLEPR